MEETVGMINDCFKASLSSVPTDDPSKVVLTSEKYLRPYLNFIKENRRAYKVIHQKTIFSILKRHLKAFISRSSLLR